MPKFRVEVTRRDEFIVEIDPSVYTDQQIKEFRESFYPAKDYHDIAKYVGVACSQDRLNDFHEGFGRIDVRYEGEISERREGEYYAEGIVVEAEYECDIETDITEIK
ncbi:MAG: hypothetical protein JSS76_08305 [Bacteroidetes bacterium]|nr:hypothetical protein [Bacteroidota bacterium]